MTRKTLLEYYREETAGMSSKEREPFRQDWHNAARKFLSLLSISSDIPTEPKERPEPSVSGTVLVRGSPNARDHRGEAPLPGKPSADYPGWREVGFEINGGVETRTFGAMFLQRRPTLETELFELYRATTPKQRGRKPKKP